VLRGQNHSFISVLITTVTSFSLFIFIQTAVAITSYVSNETLSPIFEVNTRTEIPFNSSALVNSTLAEFGSVCPPSVAIYVHGWNRDDGEAKEEFNRTQTSLGHDNYKIPLVGFSWDSKVNWEAAKINAIETGQKLAQYIISFHNKCPSTDIRLLSHSLGAAVIEAALVNLNNNSNWNSKIASVHLLGAAINNQLIANNTDLGYATEHIVDKLYNFYNPEDDALKYNQGLEHHDPLGMVGAPEGTIHPNYNDTNVANEIPPLSDADGDGNVDCFEDFYPVKLWGDNHCGYIGFRNPSTGSFRDDGAMNIVIRDWMKP
jgi:alpha/beta hydrolase family protein DUF900